MFAPRFLAGSRASDYFALIAGTRPGAGSGFRIFEPQSFAAPPYPLELCEFLAYKSVLAYETAGTIAGFIMCRSAADEAEIMMLAVDPARRDRRDEGARGPTSDDQIRSTSPSASETSSSFLTAASAMVVGSSPQGSPVIWMPEFFSL